MLLVRLSLAGIAVLLAAAPTALAGRVIVTGHDADLHCVGGQQCHYINVAVSFVRAGAPDPSKPVLVLDRGALQVVTALDRAFPAGSVAREVVEPRSPAFASVTLSTSKYSAIIVASDTTCGGCDLNEYGSTPDSDAINARKGDIEKFFNSGGGILAFSGASHGGNDSNLADDVYYNFLPLPVGAAAVSPPFKLTPLGSSLGFLDDPSAPERNDINCCPTHNSFNLPAAGSELKVAETDSKALAATLVAEGTVSGGTIVKTPSTTPTAKDVIKLPSSKKCVSRRVFRIRLKKPRGLKIESAVVFVNGKRAKVVKGKRVRSTVDLRGLPKGRFKVKITVLLSNGKFLSGTRKYRTCTKKRRSGSRSPV